MVDEPKAMLLLSQARNKMNADIPKSVFAHRAQLQLQLVQLKAQDQIFLELGVEYDDYLKMFMEHELEGTEEFN